MSSTFTGFTYQNGWSDFGGGFQKGEYRIVKDVVEIRGVLGAGTGASGPSVITHIPIAPQATEVFPSYAITGTLSSGNGGLGSAIPIYIGTDGNLTFAPGPGSSGLAGGLTLGNITFSRKT